MGHVLYIATNWIIVTRIFYFSLHEYFQSKQAVATLLFHKNNKEKQVQSQSSTTVQVTFVNTLPPIFSITLRLALLYPATSVCVHSPT